MKSNFVFPEIDPLSVALQKTPSFHHDTISLLQSSNSCMAETSPYIQRVPQTRSPKKPLQSAVMRHGHFAARARIGASGNIVRSVNRGMDGCSYNMNTM